MYCTGRRGWSTQWIQLSTHRCNDQATAYCSNWVELFMTCCTTGVETSQCKLVSDAGERTRQGCVTCVEVKGVAISLLSVLLLDVVYVGAAIDCTSQCQAPLTSHHSSNHPPYHLPHPDNSPCYHQVSNSSTLDGRQGATMLHGHGCLTEQQLALTIT